MSTTQYSMSYTALERPAGKPSISGLFGPILSAANRAYGFYSTRRALLALDDHMLSDIGLHRSQIDGVARSLSRL
jgi:hypothetical protein